MMGKVARTTRGLWALLATLLLATPLSAQTASILPNAKTQFLDATGTPLVGGFVYFCVPNTNNICVPGSFTPKTTWQDAFQNTPNANPVVLDSAGSAFIFGSGNYAESVYDQFNNLIWSGYLSAPGTSILTALCTTSGAFPLYNATANLWVCSTAGGTGSLATLSGGPLTINPTTGTTNQGFTVTQTGPSAPTTGPLIYNNIVVANPSSVTAPSTLTNGMLNAESRALYVESDDSSGTTVAVAGAFHMVVNSGTPAGDKVAVIGNAYTNKSINGFLLGIDAVAAVDTGGSTPDLVGLQSETGFYGSGTATNRYGIEVTNDTGAEASGFDAAIAIDNVGTAAGAYFNGLSFGSPVNLAPAIALTGNAITVQQALTIANFCNCANFTLTGDTPINFGNPFFISNLNNQNATTQSGLANNNGGNATIIEALYSNGTNNVTVGLGGVNLTGVYQGKGFLTANGTAPLIIGTSGNTPLQFFINNSENARFNTSGGLSIGTTTDAGTGALLTNTSIKATTTIEATTGFRINGNPGLTQTCTVNQAKTLIFTLGILTGGTCNS
jgi:hypothetical protein